MKEGVVLIEPIVEDCGVMAPDPTTTKLTATSGVNSTGLHLAHELFMKLFLYQY